MNDLTVYAIALAIVAAVYGIAYLVLERPWSRPRALCSCGWHRRFVTIASAQWGLRDHALVCKGTGTAAPLTRIEIDRAHSA